MRSSKSRSRSKPNRQRSMGNVVNRVFDSSGPEGKVRGTPQQIIDKYLMLARDAQLSNDRVAEQSFFQHAEHYTRMLSEAQREMAREQEARQQQQNQQGQGSQNGQDGDGGSQGGGQPHQGRNRGQDRRRDSGPADVIDIDDDDGPALVDTPEAGPAKPADAAQPDRPRREQRPRGPRRPRNPDGPAEAPGEKSPAAE